MVPSLPVRSRRTASRLLGTLAALIATVAAAGLLSVTGLADVFVAAWVLGGALAAAVGGTAAWTGRRALLWVVALLLSTFSVGAMASIGAFFAPAAICLLGAALLSGWAGPLVAPADPAATPRTAAARTLAGVAAVGGGAWLVRAGAFERELFAACVSETFDCVLARTNWVGVGATVLGLAAVAFGGRLLVRVAVAVRALASGARAT